MTTDPFTTDALAESARLAPTPEDGERFYVWTTRDMRDHAVEMAEWAREHLAAQEPQVTIRSEGGKPATCEVRQGGALIFSGRDHSADVRVAAQEPTDGEVEAAARALAYWDGADGWLTPGWTGEIPETAYRQGARKALAAARTARRDEEKR